MTKFFSIVLFSYCERGKIAPVVINIVSVGGRLK